MVNFKDIYIYTSEARAEACGRLAIHNRTMTNHTNDFFSVTRNRPSTCFFAREMSNDRFVRRNDRFVSGKFLFLSVSPSNRNRSNRRTRRNLSSKTTIRNLISPNCSTIISNSTFQPSIDEKLPHFSPNSIIIFIIIPWSTNLLSRKKERILFSYPILHTLSRGPLKNLVSPNFGYFLWINLYSFSLYYYSILSRDRKQSGMAERGRGAVFTSSFRDEIFSLLRYFINCPAWKCRDPKFMRPACRNAADDKSFRRNVLAFLLA